MARDKFYRPGDYYQLDDNSGFKVRASQTRQQWNNIVTIPEHFNPRQPQDLVVAVRDDQTVPIPRSRQKNQFVIVGTEVAAPSPRGANVITVFSTVGFAAGNTVQVMLDSGENFQFTLGSISGNDMLWSGLGLPASVGTLYGDPIENQVLLIAIGTGGVSNLYNNGGVLTVMAAAGYPTGSAVPGAVYSNGAPGDDGSVGVVPGMMPNPSAPAVFFPPITAAELLSLGGGNLPLSGGTPGSGQLWNNGGEIAVS